MVIDKNLLNWEAVGILLICVALAMLLIWAIDKLFPPRNEFHAAEKFAQHQETIEALQSEEVNPEPVDPFVQIEALEAENIRLYGVIDTRDETIYLLRQQLAKFQNGESDSRGLGRSPLTTNGASS